jgi:cell division protein FtsI (penicillin-binding protein 3)
LKKTFGFTASGWNVAPIGGKILGRVAPILGLQPNLKVLNEGFDPFLQSIDFSKKKK